MCRQLFRSVTLLAMMAMAQWAMADTVDNQGIHVSGAGEMVIEPDMATVALQATRVGNDAASLKKELDAVAAAVIKLARKHGVARKDITAAAVQIQPNRRYDKGQQTIDGVIASRSMTLIVRKLDKLGTITNESLGAGVNTVGQITLDSSKRAELEDQALDRAVADARRLAERLANGFGVQLGRAFDVRTVGRHTVRPEMAARSLAASAPADESVSAGEITIRREVQASFRILGDAAR